MEWIAVDWGSSNLRIWAMGTQGQVLANKRSDQGMGRLLRDECEGVLLSHIERWLGDKVMPVIACGMVGSRQGWQEVPYSTTPIAPMQNYACVVSIDNRIDVRILSGIKQDNPADLMRGEETQIAGFLAEHAGFEGIICLPGTHSKWIEIRNEKVIKFQTALTGELFALLSEQSVLRHSMDSWDEAAFVQTIADTYQHPERLLLNLFSIRGRDLLNGNRSGRAVLSAMLIATELAGMSHMWRERPITIIGDGEVTRLYALALKTRGQEVRAYQACDCTLSGLQAAYNHIFQ